jgi:hypothetical protein
MPLGRSRTRLRELAADTKESLEKNGYRYKGKDRKKWRMVCQKAMP